MKLFICDRSAIIILSTAILLGIYTTVSRNEFLIGFPFRGQLINIKSKNLQIDCRGAGQPTIVFESGMDTNGSLSWELVQDEIAKHTRSCPYSRAGILWSESRNKLNRGQEIAFDLHELLTKSGENPPFILEGVMHFA